GPVGRADPELTTPRVEGQAPSIQAARKERASRTRTSIFGFLTSSSQTLDFDRASQTPPPPVLASCRNGTSLVLRHHLAIVAPDAALRRLVGLVTGDAAVFAHLAMESAAQHQPFVDPGLEPRLIPLVGLEVVGR